MNTINSIICVGGAHTSGVQCVNDHIYANEDSLYKTHGDDSHPENKASAFWVHFTPVMKIGTFNISKPGWVNKTIIYEVIKYINNKPNPEDTVAVVGFEEWNYSLATPQDHLKDVIQLHKDLKKLNVKHLMFNTQNCLDVSTDEQYDFGDSYIGPYDSDETMVSQLKAQNFDFNSGTQYFGPAAHRKWARILLNRLTQIV